MSSQPADHDAITLDQQFADLPGRQGKLAPRGAFLLLPVPAREARRTAATLDRDDLVDLLLCRRRYRRSVDALAAASAYVVDVSG